MISIVTTAINRPEIIKRTMDSFIANTNFTKFECKWIVNVDYVAKLDNADNRFEEALALCQSYSKFFKVNVIKHRPSLGPANAVIACNKYLEGDVVFYLEDDWDCHVEKRTKEKLDVKDYLERLKLFPYSTCAGRMNQLSLNPCFMRRFNYELSCRHLVISEDAEFQMQRVWYREKAGFPDQWAFDPREKKYFSDSGRPWIKTTKLVKWDRMKRYSSPIAYS